MTLGVTLLVGIQITTDTLKNGFLTTLLQSQGEVDLQIVNGTGGTYLKAADMATIRSLVPDAVGIMPELSTQIPAVVESQFNPKMAVAGIPINYSKAFGDFYDWKSGNKLELESLLTYNNSILLSSDQAEKFGLDKNIVLPINLTTQFTNLTTTFTPPVVPLSNWTVNSNFTSAGYSLDSTASNLFLEVKPVNFTGVAMVYTLNCPRLNLANYTHVNVTTTGTNNVRVLLGFSTIDGSNFDVANWTDPATLNNTEFDITQYSSKQLRGDAYLAIVSANGTQASVNVTEIAFETASPAGVIRTPIISYTSELAKLYLQVTAIFDSNRPGIGSRYAGAVFKLEHLQEWLSLQDSERKTDIIRAYLISYKTDHFVSEIDKDTLNTKLENLKAIIPKEINSQTNKSEQVYRVSSLRLDFVNIADFFISLLSTILSTLGFLIALTGVLLITNVQLMSVEDREFQTGVMRAVGENRRGIFQSIIIENLFQGIVGGLVGYLGGIAFGQVVAMYLIGLFGTGELSVRPVVSLSVVILSLIVGILISIITGILPALRASRVNIVEALRGIKIAFKAKSSRNLVALGVLMTIAGVILLLYNGIIDTATQVIWSSEGWNSLEEWRILIIAFGLLAGGIGLVLSKFISRTKAFNITAISLYIIPTFLFVVAMDSWITGITGIPLELLIVGLIEVLIGSILFIALNLPAIMRGLRGALIKIKGLKGVGQISPSLISSHITRSTLTFAIFAIILTLNVVVATLVPTNLGTVNQYDQESRGVDLTVFLNKPEVMVNDTSFSNEIYKIDNRITDVIGFKTFNPNMDFTKFTALKDPFSSEFEAGTDMLPVSIGEFRPEQIRGNASNYLDSNWRYDFYLGDFPDGVRESYNPDLTDSQILELSRKAWDRFLDRSYRMPAYNVSSIVSSIIKGDTNLLDVEAPGMGNEDPLKDLQPLKYENGSLIENPIVFTDSFLLPVGLQVWLPMNTSTLGIPIYQAFTIGGRLDNQRGGGFPLATSTNSMSGDVDVTAFLGTIYMPDYWANQTNFLGEANGATSISRGPNQYNTYLIKTTLGIDDPELDNIARKIEDFTNTNDQGYRLLAKDDFVFGSAEPVYTRIQTTLRMTDRISSFLQIYVSFGLIIGAVGMGVISVRNVAERKREIGMMRAIGFPRSQVMISVLLELVVLGVIGLALGVINGLIVSFGFANLQNTTLIIPWDQLGVYLTFIVLIAIGAGSIPAYVASRIPPAEALRYVG
ncbi:MAG TPA: FtsX-like permease family protein [Candidatus Sulfotelmatobacter sp.]|nr:FtsX-like permease family protein [Candidatus Sulfotelmatobacter sp.]